VINWMRRWREHGSATAKPSGGSISPLEKHAKWLLSLVSKQADRALDEVVVAMVKRGIAGSRSAVSRFYIRHNITFKKSLQAAERQRADVARARRRWMRDQGMLDPARLVAAPLRRQNDIYGRERQRRPFASPETG